MVKDNTCIHVEFHPTGKHSYFGSIAAIFEVYTTEEIGITQHYLYDYDIDTDKPYTNKFVTIRKGPIHRKKQKKNKSKNV